MSDLTTAYFEIIKSDKNSDGTLMVYGKATDSSLDIDQQICDPVWLDDAMPEWFKTGGNIREQHSNIAAGVAKEYEKKADGHYIHALVVDPISVRKVDTGVLKGFSIGIKSPRVVRDEKAANGRIIDGQIVEVSLVDRPANPNCQLVLAKSVNGESGVWKVEELIEKSDEDTLDKEKKKKPDYEGMLQGGSRSEPANKDLYNRIVGEAKKKFDVYPSAVANAWVVQEYKKRGGSYKKKEKSEDSIDIPKSIMADILKFDKNEFEAARNALANLIAVEAESMKEGHNEINSISHLLESVSHLIMWYEGEKAEGEVEEEMVEMTITPDEEKTSHTEDEEKMHHDKAMTMKPKKDETQKDYMKRCKEAGMKDDAIKGMCDKYFGAEKSADAEEVAEEETPAVETPAEETPAVETTEEEKDSSPVTTDEDVEAIVEKAVKSATETIRSEVALLVAEKESALNKAATLESELATAKSLAVGGGPKRTSNPIDANATNDLLIKALVYKQKANATTDPMLAKGYKALYDEYMTKASTNS